MESDRPVKVLVLTYNRTLCGYVSALAEKQAAEGARVDIRVDTFAHWVMGLLGGSLSIGDRNAVVQRLARQQGIKLPMDFLCQEIEYVLGRFPTGRRTEYLTIERTGRGTSPRVDRTMRQALLDVLDALSAEFLGKKEMDWEDLAYHALGVSSQSYDVIIIDEAQDFSANQIRAVKHHLAQEHALTLVLDTAQRLYPRGYTWTETGLEPTRIRYYRLQENHRNSIEIAQFAKGILSGMVLDDDGTLPDFDRATRHGAKPAVVKGRYFPQLDYAINYLRTKVDLKNETVAFLKPKGGGWFDDVRERLTREDIAFEEITRQKEWPDSEANVMICTMHSAKGLEFDHVICVGLNAKVTEHGDGEDDDQLVTLRRLLAMAVARARKSVIVGYKLEEASDLVKYFQDGTYDEISL